MAGDLLLVIRSEPDLRFERHCAGLWHEETIGIADAALGSTIEVPTSTAKAIVKWRPAYTSTPSCASPARACRTSALAVAGTFSCA